MPTKMATASGNSSATVWALCEALFVNTTTAGSLGTTYQSTPVFTLPAGSYDGFALYQGTNNATAGATITARLEDSGVEIPGTLVTINAVDAPVTLNTDFNGGWLFFKFAAPITLAAPSSNIRISALSSTTGVISFFSSTGTTWSRFVRSTALSNLGATDDAIVCKEHTGPGASNAIAITFDSASLTIGSTNNSAINAPAIHCGNGGTFAFSTAAGNRTLTLNGCIEVKRGGAYRMGNSKLDRVPLGSIATAILNGAASVDNGLNVRNGGELCLIGASRFNTPTNCYTRLNADLAAGAGTAPGSITVLDCTGWQVGDTVIFSSHNDTNSIETRTIATVDSATTFSVTAAITNARFGPASSATRRPTVVMNATRNVRIQGASSAIPTYITVQPNNCLVKLVDSVITNLGSGTSNKRGVEVYWGSSDVEIENFVANTGTGSSARGLVFNSGNAFTGNYRVTGFCAYTIQGELLNLGTTTSTNQWNIDRVCLLNATNGASATISDVGGNLSNLVVYGGSTTGITYGEQRISFTDTGLIGSCSNIEAGSFGSSAPAINITGSMAGLISGVTVSQDTNGGVGGASLMVSNTSEDLIIENVTAVSCLRAITISDQVNCTISNVSIAVGASPACVAGFRIHRTFNQTQGALPTSCQIQSANIGAGVANGIEITQAVAYCAGITFLDLVNSASVKVLNNDRLADNSWFQSINQDSVEGSLFVYKGAGTNRLDTSIFATASPSLRMSPLSATRKLRSSSLAIPLQAGGSATVKVKVRESIVADGADYNGTRARLRVQKDYLAGIASDTTLATATVASEGAFEELTGVVGPVARACILRVYVDCDGTTGFVNVDDLYTVSPVEASGMSFADFDGTSEMPFLNSRLLGSGGTSKPNLPYGNEVIG